MVNLGSMTHMTHLVKMNKLPYSNIVVNRNSVSQCYNRSHRGGDALALEKTNNWTILYLAPCLCISILILIKFILSA